MFSQMRTDQPVSKLHSLYLQTSPTEEQERLYQQANVYRGYAESDLESSRVEAAILLAIAQPKGVTVMLCVHSAKAVVFKEHLNMFLDKIYSKCRELSGDRVALAKHYRDIFSRLFINSHSFGQPVEPAYWVAVGFTEADPLPHWMKDRLLSV